MAWLNVALDQCSCIVFPNSGLDDGVTMFQTKMLDNIEDNALKQKEILHSRAQGNVLCFHCTTCLFLLELTGPDNGTVTNGNDESHPANSTVWIVWFLTISETSKIKINITINIKPWVRTRDDESFDSGSFQILTNALQRLLM
eukprot:5227579-Ditylum_brightwellii.AAC.1